MSPPLLAANTPACPQVFTSPLNRSELDTTSKFIAYIGDLIEHRVIKDYELQRFITSLEHGVLENPITPQEAQLSSAFLIHHRGLNEYLQGREVLDQAKILAWSQAQLVRKEQIHQQREDTRVETAAMARPMQFAHINPGTFWMGEGEHKVEVTLTQAFEIMTTPVTQYQYAMIMGHNPAAAIDGPDSIVIPIQGQLIKMQPDHPVEQVSWYDAHAFIETLNERSQAGDPVLAQLIPGHQVETHYRLPTEAEWEYVATAEGTMMGRWFFGDDAAKLEDYAVVYDEKKSGPQAVRQKRPLLVNGQAIYDLYGNVWEWVEDAYHEQLPGGIDPLVLSLVGKPYPSYVVRGGGWLSTEQSCRSAFRFNWKPEGVDSSVGLRLLGYLPVKSPI